MKYLLSYCFSAKGKFHVGSCDVENDEISMITPEVLKEVIKDVKEKIESETEMQIDSFSPLAWCKFDE